MNILDNKRFLKLVGGELKHVPITKKSNIFKILFLKYPSWKDPNSAEGSIRRYEYPRKTTHSVSYLGLGRYIVIEI